jgi:hypothetical protein
MALVPFKYCNPYMEDSNERSFYIGDKYVIIHQDKKSGIGFTLWDCV